jgi:SAM-dependent methyltransferase
MTTDQAAYTLDNAWEKAEWRLRTLESIYDPGTIGRFTDLGVGEGWRCLELGAGGGSIARWLCDRVGPTGSVTAVDLEPKFLEADPRPNMEIHRRDFVADGLPGEGYDLIHTRCVLMHIPNPERLIAQMVSRLRPGGVILLEEGDFYPFTALLPSLYAEVWEEYAAAAGKAGGDFYWARHIPEVLNAAGLVGVKATGEVLMFQGGPNEAWTQLTAMTFEQATPLLVAAGYDPARIAAGLAEMTDPGRWFPMCSLIVGSGRRP